MKDRLATVETEIKANDPKALKAEVAKLRRELAAKPAAIPAGPSREDTATINALRKALEAVMKFIVEIDASNFSNAGGEKIDKAAIEKVIADATAHATKIIEGELARRNKELEKFQREGKAIIGRISALLEKDVAVRVDVRHNEPVTISTATPKASKPAAPLVHANGQFSGPQHRVLRALSMWKALGHENPSREMVAAASGYSPSSGGFGNLLGSLTTAGAIGKPMPGHISLLVSVDDMSPDEGRAMLLGYLSNPQRKLVDTFAQNGSATSGLTYYDLELGAKFVTSFCS